MPEPRLPRMDSIGYTTGRIVMPNGVPVGGESQITVHKGGAYNFTGHFHNSGFPSYNLSFGWALRDSKGQVYVFVKEGRLHGTIEPGSRDLDWGESGTNPALGAGWSDLESGFDIAYHYDVDVDWTIFIKPLIDAVAAAGSIASIITVVKSGSSQ